MLACAEDNMMKDATDYYRPTVYIPKEDKTRIEARARELGLSVSSYICMLIDGDIGLSDKAAYGTPGEGRRDKLSKEQG